MLRLLGGLLVVAVAGLPLARVDVVTVTPDTLALTVGDVGRATCTPRNKFGAALAALCNWRVTDTAIAKVTTKTQASAITAKQLGTTRVIASAGGHSDTLRLSVIRNTTTVPPLPDTVYSLLVLPDSQGAAFTEADYRAKGIWYLDSVGGAYDSVGTPLGFACPAAALQCPQKPGPEYCVFLQFRDGKIAERAKDRSPMCDSIYATFAPSHQGPAPLQQLKADSACMVWTYEPTGTITNHSGRIGAPPDEHCGTPT